MSSLDNISHIYRGLLLRNRAFASFKKDELDLINTDIKNHISEGEWILDPMSGYGGTMSYFGSLGYKTFNIEINPPSYYWQLLNNPQNNLLIIETINKLIAQKNNFPHILDKFSVSEDLFSNSAIQLIDDLFNYIYEIVQVKELTIAILLPFVARFANYQRSINDITHFKQGGFCSFLGWEVDFFNYLNCLNKFISDRIYKELEHKNVSSSIFDYDINNQKFDYFVTSPPYPNYRDYSKLFKIENWVLDNIFYPQKTDFNQMIGSNKVTGKTFGIIESNSANNFLNDLLLKSKKLSSKSKRDIEVYYHPYFSLYFYEIQEAYRRIDKMLSDSAVGYLVVNDNITRDIPIPVGKSICDIFSNLGYQTKNYDESQISHFGNIRKSAKRINSLHVRHILKVWKE